MTELIDTVEQVVKKSITEAYKNLKTLVANGTDDIEINDKSVALTLFNYKYCPGQPPKYSRANNFTEALDPSNSNENLFLVAISFDVDNDDFPPTTENTLLRYITFNQVPAGTRIDTIAGKENNINWRSAFVVYSKYSNNPEIEDLVLGLQENMRTYNAFIKYNFSKLLPKN